MTAATLARYLVGDRAAIRAVAATRGAWVVGLVLVLGAGLAREYDHEDLLHEPWHALLPLAASLVTATVLFLLLRVVSWRRSGAGWPRQGGYAAFLGLYWATAPLAWLYALPVERVLPEAGAVAANLWLLGLVSLWRVLLMSRVVQVVWQCHWGAAFHVVGCFGWAVVAAVLWFTPLPLFAIMGGIELGPGEAILRGTTFVVLLLASVSAPWWLMALAMILLLRRRPGGAWTPDPGFGAGRLRVQPSLWWCAWALVAVGLALLPFTQPEQWRRHAVERALGAGDVTGAIRAMARYDRAAFPPHWEPPPRTGAGERRPPLPEIVAAIAAVDPPAWVRELFLAKVANLDSLAGSGGVVGTLDDEALERYVALLERLPEGQRVAAIHARSLRALRERHPVGGNADDQSADLPAGLSAVRRALYERVERRAGIPAAAAASPPEMPAEIPAEANPPTAPSAGAITPPAAVPR
jgi:hypothetical protein